MDKEQEKNSINQEEKMKKPICFTILGNPIPKKNSQRICISKKTGKPFIQQDNRYLTYEHSALWQISWKQSPIEIPVNIKAIYYRDSRRRIDLLNLAEATDDILVKAGVLSDDDRNHVVGHDGSRVYYDKENPRVEITITGAESEYPLWDTKNKQVKKKEEREV